MKIAMSLLFALCAVSCGCTQSAPPPPPAAAAQAPAPTVLDPQLRALQKAKDVQKTVDQHKADVDKKLDEQGG